VWGNGGKREKFIVKTLNRNISECFGVPQDGTSDAAENENRL